MGQCRGMSWCLTASKSKHAWFGGDFPIFAAIFPAFFWITLRSEVSKISRELFGCFLGVCFSPAPSRQPLFETSDKRIAETATALLSFLNGIFHL